MISGNKVFNSFLLYLLLVILATGCIKDKHHQWIIKAPAGDKITQINQDGETIIPNGRILTPRGKQIMLAPHPYGLIMSPDGNTVVTANSGTAPLSISIITDLNYENPKVRQIPPGANTDRGVLASVFMGLAVSPDNERVYVSGGQENLIYIFNLLTGENEGLIDCSVSPPGTDYSHGYIGDIAMTSQGELLYAVDQINFRVVIIDLPSLKIVGSIPVGKYPFGITLSPDEKTVYVANVGVFEYEWISGLDFDRLKETAWHYPPFAYLSEEMIQGIQTDSIEVPGLGDPNVPESFSVWAIDVRDSENPVVKAKINTGILVGQVLEDIPAVGGASPNSVAATDEYVFVSNGNNDCISVISTNKDTVVTNIFLTPDERLGNLRGIIPFGLALTPDHRRLYVAESGINAVGVIDVPTLEVIGHIPVGWFPSKLAVSNDGTQLIVANAKGFGNGPNGGPNFMLGPEGSNIGRLMKGTLSILDIPADNKLISETQRVIDNNYKFNTVRKVQRQSKAQNPVPLYPGQNESPIKHIVFISKENRTYDEVFGQIAGGEGEPSLARYGSGVTFSNSDSSQVVTDATVMVNHLALAEQFAIADNFYVDSDHSADGHRWLVDTYPNEWVETSVSASYGGNRNFRQDSKAPGNFAFVGATGAIYPEDYNEAGSIWDHFARNNISFFNFGFGLELAPAYSDTAFKYTGVRYVVNYPLPAPMYEHSSRLYATYNMGIPDQFRVDMFIKEFKDRWLTEEAKMPSILTIILLNDHGAGERPEAGYPSRESYMADNDLALGRIIEFLSHTPYWTNMAVFVTEDDSQDGVDHIDAHRSLLMVISPYVKKNFVSHIHYSFGSIFKTFWHILGAPYLNQYDATATDLSEFFMTRPDYKPYNAHPVDARIFEPEKALDPFDEEFNWEAVINSPVIDNPKDFLKSARQRDSRLRKSKESD